MINLEMSFYVSWIQQKTIVDIKAATRLGQTLVKKFDAKIVGFSQLSQNQLLKHGALCAFWIQLIEICQIVCLYISFN